MAFGVAVIIGLHGGGDALRACLAALAPQVDDDVQVVVVQNRQNHRVAPTEPDTESIRIIPAEAHLLTPALWQIGIERSNAPIVALTIANCIPAPDWIASIRRAFENPDVVAVGGVFHPPENGSATDWAVYFARYSGFMTSNNATPKPVNDIAADNGAYRLDAINACKSRWVGGFWETLVHPCLRENGEKILFDPAVQVRFVGGINLWAMAKQRFRHGRHYGSTRGGSRLPRVITSPFIPVLLLLRIIRRVRAAHPEWMRQLIRALPALIVLVLAWSIGEARGYLTPIENRK